MLQNTCSGMRLNVNQWKSGSEVAVAEDDEVASDGQGDAVVW